jgi:hypothetical protein
MLILITGYSFNKTIKANTKGEPTPPQDTRNSELRVQIVNENSPSNRVYTVNDIGIRIHLEKRRSVNSMSSRKDTLRRCL